MYSYNGLNHRVKKVVGGVTTTSVFSCNWQELESTASGVTTTYVWGLRYVDDLIYRDKGAERLYSIADPNWNVVALANTSGTVLERMTYSAFGKVNWLDASFGAKTASGYTWTRTFTGQVFENETGVMLYRNRVYHAALGRFVTRDPIKYRSKDFNLQRYVFNQSPNSFDSVGLEKEFDPCRRKKCCDDSRNNSETTHARASVICCDGMPTICMYDDNITGNFENRGVTSEYAKLAIYACILVHEITHLTHLTCKGKDEGYQNPDPYWPNLPSIPGSGETERDRAECAAYTVSIRCLEIAKNGCLGNTKCEAEIENEIRDQGDNWSRHCYPNLLSPDYHGIAAL